MKKVLLSLFVFTSVVLMTSCGSVTVLPVAKSSVKAVTLNELNLSNSDYSVLNTISESAVISVTYYSNNQIEVRDAENTFSYILTPVGKKENGTYQLQKQEGVIRAGFLWNDYGRIDLTSPEDIARLLAVYRLINRSQEVGSDGLIEPVFSTNIEGTSGSMGKMTVSYKTTVSAKPIKLKVTGK